MTRLVIVTVGKTHSGKSTFARILNEQLDHSLVIDQDNHAQFINMHYRSLLPEHGPNTFKHTINQTIIDYAINQTTFHLILCNAYRSRRYRQKVLAKFHASGFTSILVHFNIPIEVLEARIENSQRDTNIFRTASGFREVLAKQQAESSNEDIATPEASEANHIFQIKREEDVPSIIQKILQLSENLSKGH